MKLPITATLLSTAGERFELPEGATTPALRVQLVDAAGEPVDLAHAALGQFKMGRKGEQVAGGSATFPDPNEGVVEYQFDDGETDEPGRFRGRFEIGMADGTRLVAPSEPVVVFVRQQFD